jgi:hypothetical protein
MEPIRHEITVPGPPPVAFEVFTLGMGGWWDPAYSPDPAAFEGIALTPEVGSPVTMVLGADSVVFGAVTVWEPASRYAQTFWLAMDPAHPSTLDVAFRDVDGGPGGECHVVLEHGGWSAENEHVRDKYGDWPLLLDRYAQAMAETG